MEGITCCSSERSSVFVSYIVIVGCLCWGRIYNELLSQPLLLTSIGLLLVSLMWSHSASFQVCLRGNCSICSCRFGVYMGGGVLEIFLPYPVEPPPRCKTRHKIGVPYTCQVSPRGDADHLWNVAQGACGDSIHQLEQGRGKSAEMVPQSLAPESTPAVPWRVV